MRGKQNQRRKRNRKSDLAVYALYFILAALALSTGTLSRYRAQTAVQDTAAVARPYNEPKFTFTAEKLYPGYTKTQIFKVSNKDTDGNFVSQVKMNYKVEIRGTTNLPLTLKLKRKEGNGAESYVTLEESARDANTGEKTWTTKTDTVMPLTEKTDTWTVELIWPAETAKSNPAYADEVDSFTVTIKAAQSDN